MARVKRGVTARRRHKKILKEAKGYYGARSRVFRVAKQAVTKAQQYAYIGRKQKKRNFRSLWIVRINAASRQFGMSYSRLIAGLNAAEISIDRKVLADLAVHDIDAFGAIAAKAAEALGAKVETPAKPVAVKPEAKPAAPTKAKPAVAGKGDDLTRIEGIGPKINELLHAAGIATFADLAKSDVEKLRAILHDAGSRYASHDPETWPEQSALAAAGEFDKLEALQAELDGGRRS